jgi:hypothetical protein
MGRIKIKKAKSRQHVNLDYEGDWHFNSQRQSGKSITMSQGGYTIGDEVTLTPYSFIPGSPAVAAGAAAAAAKIGTTPRKAPAAATGTVTVDSVNAVANAVVIDNMNLIIRGLRFRARNNCTASAASGRRAMVRSIKEAMFTVPPAPLPPPSGQAGTDPWSRRRHIGPRTPGLHQSIQVLRKLERKLGLSKSPISKASTAWIQELILRIRDCEALCVHEAKLVQLRCAERSMLLERIETLRGHHKERVIREKEAEATEAHERYLREHYIESWDEDPLS